MSPSSPNCTHDRGRGTTVCLRCRHEQVVAAQRKRQKFLMQFLALASVCGLLGVVGVSAASTLRDRVAGSVTQTSEGAVTPAEENKAGRNDGTPTDAAPVQAEAAGQAQTRTVDTSSALVPPAVTQASTTPAPRVTESRRSGFMIDQGRSALTDSIYALRAGDSVVVNFDAQGFRTRRADKLERSLRLTLPLVYGRSASTVLDSVPDGQLVINRDVVGELATAGMRLELSDGTSVRIRVLTRPVSDGPIAVGYVTSIGR